MVVCCGCAQPSSHAYTQHKPMHLTKQSLPLLLLLLQLPGTLFKKQMLEDEAKLHKRDWTEDISKWEQRQPDYIWDQKKIADCPSKRPSRGSEETGRAFFSNDGEHR
eukprot:GHVS01053439.1.p2 GENE.GHVS01053439.1~~GHVS01053439.1.p2  ORF type:complete len:107 (+),score=20.30 GHVS01053439.1:587-907(+)